MDYIGTAILFLRRVYLAIPGKKIAIEYEGIVADKSRHTNIKSKIKLFIICLTFPPNYFNISMMLSTSRFYLFCIKINA